MKTIEQLSVDTIRILAAEAIQKANSGHPGMAIGSAPIAYAIWKNMKHNPANTKWLGRDRFVLSAGHASMLEYAMLHLYGYGISMDDIKQFRQWGSKTPGHPEYKHTAGVEATTGPLGQGIAMAVGMAIAETHMAAKYNVDGFNVFDNRTYVLCGDGCLMEGVAYEAISLAGTLKLNKLTLIYDRNQITIEGSTELAFNENIAARFAACGWQVISVPDGNNIDAISKALAVTKLSDKPTAIIVETKIGYGTPKEGKSSVHGSPLGDENIAVTKANYGWEYEAPFTVPEEVYAHFRTLAENCASKNAEYDEMMNAYKQVQPELYAQLMSDLDGKIPEAIANDPELINFSGSVSTRSASSKLLNVLAKHIPGLIGGSADLAPSNLTRLADFEDYSVENRAGRNIHFGVREFAMAAISNGMALYGGLRAFCSTFLVFVDYLKPALRLSALMGLPVMYIMTHDSIGVGEDGPTHQPIEQLAMLRSIPNAQVFRPADGKETAAAYLSALNAQCPTVLALSRQNLPTYEATGMDAMKGGYIIRKPKGTPDCILMATGSELELAIKAADVLAVRGYTAQVVSMPCIELFDKQTAEYKESVLPSVVRARVAVEALSGYGWHKYTGLDGAVVSIDRFGASAPAKTVFEKLGMTVDCVVDAALGVIKK
ncbi:MAG: transketolase [Eubacteriales bacterium]|nr:transketolase [Eubacteriales bacterium]